MATDFDVRLCAPFTVQQLRDGRQQVLREIMPNARPGPLQVRIWLEWPYRRPRMTPRASTAFLQLVHHVGRPMVPDYLVTTPDAEALTMVWEHDIGYADDADGGHWLNVTRHYYREPPTALLSIAVVTAAARLTDAYVIDEYSLLAGERLADPDAVVAHLRNTDAPGPFAEMARDTLERAGIHYQR